MAQGKKKTTNTQKTKQVLLPETAESTLYLYTKIKSIYTRKRTEVRNIENA
jgi:hypothetical protein